ncbi:probable LRR receptor-like serine/threonine-protein kinase At3g47570 isoform X1 [Hibiscus syriacus]|uniref:probable LRR receptor-like serine/threonine-protein kinase At3g47570 isoform X1 n=1 Tax=Hibiscus syriacus TaxID=106335 RepID=UPI0019226E68|nr:probable LRR receptor-like serine/threonine-protein kinase At3g47570 isoform X1 [Hibiscus syriacus]
MLEYLYLRGNSFEGTIPSSFQKLRSMQVLDVSHNNLSGLIPEFLAELPFFTNLNLSFNSFEGKVPTKGVFNNISAFSVVGNNKLCGGIEPLRLPDCSTEIAKKGKNFRRSAIIASSIVLFAVLFFISLVAIKRRLSLSRKKEGLATPLDKKHPQLSYAELLHATDSFSLANLIGKGRYGSVYKGILSGDDQTTVAVKVLNLQQQGADRTFKAECEALRKLRHRNLVKVITSCSSIDFQGNNFKALVLELLPNGSLETWLHPSSTELHNSPILNLIQRLNIAIDVASALDYLHSQFDKPVVHCDLKPSNVLLDTDFTAHISDFGLTRFLSDTTEQSITEQSSSMGIRGTIGYIPPEYGMGKEISTHGDVYSYGIVLMELFTGKRPTDSMFTGKLSLGEPVKTAMPDHVAEIVDTWLNFEGEAAVNQNGQSSRGIDNIWKCLGSVLSIGVSCSADSPNERMNIGDVLRELQMARNMLLEDQRRGAL